MADQNPDLQAAVDARLSDALEATNFRITLNNQKQNARLKLQKDLTYSTNGGIFNITPELISFVGVLLFHGKEDAIILDTNKNPIEITDLRKFNETILSMYYERTNEFLVEYKTIQRSRNTKAVVGE